MRFAWRVLVGGFLFWWRSLFGVLEDALVWRGGAGEVLNFSGWVCAGNAQVLHNLRFCKMWVLHIPLL